MIERGPVAVDLHCHVLPGIDDGARDLDDAVAMALQAQADGIGAICATPHIRDDHDVRIPELLPRLAELSEAVRAAGCNTRILPGGEVAVTVLDRLDQNELEGVALGGGARWILLEPAPGALDDAFERAVTRLRVRGFRALIAHPERHLTQDLVPRLARLVGAGALVQATGAAFIDETTRSGMLDLARAGVIHVLGSDSHSSRAGRRVQLSASLDVLGTASPTREYLQWIGRTAPQAIVGGLEVTSPFTGGG
jgi:protein-tyrosine phosphatase